MLLRRKYQATDNGNDGSTPESSAIEVKRLWLRGLVGAVAGLAGATVLRQPEEARATTIDSNFIANGTANFGFQTTGFFDVGADLRGGATGVVASSPSTGV